MTTTAQTLRSTLQRDVFQHNSDDRLIGLVGVTKPGGKKKKLLYLCLVLNVEKRMYLIYTIKRTDQMYKKHHWLPLSDLRTVDGKSDQRETPEFDMHFTGKQVFKWIAKDYPEKVSWVNLLYRVCEQGLTGPQYQRPTFLNIKSEVLASPAKSSDSSGRDGGALSPHNIEARFRLMGHGIEMASNDLLAGSAGADDGDLEDASYEVLTAREEADLERLMEQNEFTIGNAEAFTEQLCKEVQSMDSQNIHTIMGVENQLDNLARLIQNSLDETDKLEMRLDFYEKCLKSVQDIVIDVERKEAMLQTQKINSERLASTLGDIIDAISFSRENEITLLEANFRSSEGLKRMLCAAKELQEALNVELHPATKYMVAVQEQRGNLARIKMSFVNRFVQHMSKVFSFLVEEYTRSFKSVIEGRDIALAAHDPIHTELIQYTEMVRWLKSSDKDAYYSLIGVYVQRFKPMYDSEFAHFFESVHDKISGGRYATLGSHGSGHGQHGHIAASSHGYPGGGGLTPNTGFDPRRKSAANASQDATSASSRGRSSSVNHSDNLMPDSTSSKGSEISVGEWEEFDSSVERILSSIDPICIAEQKFCLEFFDAQENLSTGGGSQGPSGATATPGGIANLMSVSASGSLPVSPSPSNMSQSSNDAAERLSADPVKVILSELMSQLEPQFMRFANHYDRLDGKYSMYLLVRLTPHVLSARDGSSYLSKTYGSILIQIKRNFDRYMQAQLLAIDDARAPKKAKCGILPFIKKFEEFSKHAELVFKCPGARRTDIDRWYSAIVRAIFDAILRLSLEHAKTPAEMVRIENFHYLHSVLSQLKIQSLENEKKDAKVRYNEAVKEYVSRYFGRPLEKLNIFFEGVQAKVAQGVKEEEISYQLAFSKQELRKVIADCSLKSVKKGLEEMYRKVEKHVSEPEGGLIQVIWRSMQEEFISQYKTLQDMIERCYPGSNITLAFTIDDVLSVFSDIAFSH